MKVFNKYKHTFPLWLAIITASFSHNSWSISTQQLLKNVYSNLPEQQLFQGFSQTQQALQQNQQAFFPESPNLILNHQNDALTGNGNLQNWEIGLEATLWPSGQKQNLQAQKRANQQQQQALQATLNLKASNILRQLIANLQQAQTKQQMAQQQLTQTQQLAQMIEQRVKIGASPKLDSLLAQKSVLEAQQALIQTKSQLKSALKTYQKWTQTPQLPDNYQEKLASPQSQDWWLQHPEIQHIQAQIAKLQAQKQQIKSKAKNPIQAYVGLNRESSKDGTANTSLILEITLPLGKNPVNQIELAEHSQTLFALKAELKQRIQQLKIQKIQADAQVRQLQQQTQLAKQQLQLAQETLKMAKQSYQAGETGIQNLLISQQQYIDAEKHYQMRQIQTQQAIAQFNQIIGVHLQ